MKALIYATVLLLLSVPVYCFENLDKDMELETWLVEGERLKSRLTGLNLHFIYGKNLRDNLEIDTSVSVRLQTGSNKSLGIEEFSPQREWVLNQASLNTYLFNSHLNVSIGAINQNWIDSPLLVSDIAFMATYQELKLYRSSNINLKLMAQQSIPNNQTLSLRAGGVDEGTPQFFIQGGEIAFSTSNSSFTLRSFYFLFDGLAGEVANQSRFMGNDVIGTSGSGSPPEFIYDFQGWNSQLRASFHFKNFDVLTLFDHLYNSKAANSSNQGYRFGIGISTGTLEFKANHFRLEKNASVGFYNDKTYGHNNKKGFNIGLTKNNITQANLSASLLFTNAKVIDLDNILDSNMKFLSAYLRIPF